ncbi:hypothetical protein DFQ28_005570 [Apophysomyces sp. BC1034]|nr:hypothetical protein DFQ30_010947 [Apophysomyces sp. BC1015]KAG0193340.1 hypothetical protein DFQ28_005570 [Apophysomyces sp. BC1034]
MNDPLHDNENAVRPVSSALLDPQRLRSLRTLTHVLYALYALLWLTGGVSALVAVIVNYVKRDDVAGTQYAGHFDWQIRTFWWGLMWGGIGFVTMVIMIGFVIWLATGVWVLYRIIKGWLYLNDNKPLPVRQRAAA